MEDQRRERIAYYVALRANQANSIGDPSETINKLCAFYVDDAEIVGRDGLVYKGKDGIAHYVRHRQPASVITSAVAKDPADNNVFRMTIASALIKAVAITIEFDSNRKLSFRRIIIQEGTIFSAITTTLFAYIPFL